MGRKIVSVIVGVFVAFIVVFFFENINHRLFPFPEGMNIPEGLEEFTKSLPLTFWVLLLFGWFAGSFVAGLIVRKISDSDERSLPLIAGGIMTAASIANFFLIPHPMWFIVVALCIYIPAVLLGHRVGGRF